MVRFVSNMMLKALSDTDVQRKGIVVVNDMTGLKLKNLDPATGKAIFGRVFPNLPVNLLQPWRAVASPVECP